MTLNRKTFAAGSVLTSVDVNNYLMDQTVQVAATFTDLTTPVGYNRYAFVDDAKTLYKWDGTSWVATGAIEQIVLTSGTTWTKADYPGMVAMKVITVGGGGGGGGCVANAANGMTAGGPGGGGSYAERVVLASDLPATVPITIGAGGGAGAATGTNGGGGGITSFGVSGNTYYTAANGGPSGLGDTISSASPSYGMGSSTPSGPISGTITKTGSKGFSSFTIAAGAGMQPRGGGASGLGGESSGYDGTTTGLAAVAGSDIGQGGGGGFCCGTTVQTAKSGAAGAAGAIILEIYR